VSGEQFLQKLKSILQPYMGELAESLSSALNRETEAHLGDIRPMDLDELQADFSGEAVLTRATFVTGVSHDVIFLVPVNWAAIWADLMVMGDGTAPFDPAQHLDAIKELFRDR